MGHGDRMAVFCRDDRNYIVYIQIVEGSLSPKQVANDYKDDRNVNDLFSRVHDMPDIAAANYSIECGITINAFD